MTTMVANARCDYLSRRLAREKTTCPGCMKTMNVATLAWSHKCRVPKRVPESLVEGQRAKTQANAERSFQQRMSRLNGGAEQEARRVAEPVADDIEMDLPRAECAAESKDAEVCKDTAR